MISAQDIEDRIVTDGRFKETSCSSTCKNLVQRVFKDTWVVMNMNMHKNIKASLFVSRLPKEIVVVIWVFMELYGYLRLLAHSW